ncbi:MAG: GNAT family N-acetyltransferase [bacterium]|nr:GNAT family N-acetyltransferase [bacterium]
MQQIVPYQDSHKPLLIELIELNVPDYFDPSEIDDYKEYLDVHREEYYVVEEGDTIIGCGGINYFLEESIARISWDAIHPDHQGKGVGSKLVAHRIACIKKHGGINKIVVRTTQVVYKFYEKSGFQLIKTEKDFWAKGFDLYQLEMDI